jgi:hypothetical protein
VSAIRSRDKKGLEPPSKGSCRAVS